MPSTRQEQIKQLLKELNHTRNRAIFLYRSIALDVGLTSELKDLEHIVDEVDRLKAGLTVAISHDETKPQ